MKSRHSVNSAISSAVMLLASACGLENNTLLLPLGIELDSAFAQNEQSLIKEDFEWLESFEMPSHEQGSTPFGAPLSRWFDDIFGGSQSQNVINFIDERSAYYIAPTRSVKRHIRLRQAGESYETASNVGTGLYLSSLAHRERVSFDFDGRSIEVNDTRVGLIKLARGFFRSESKFKDTYRVSRIGTLVHEARHSDCTGGVKRSTLKHLKSKIDILDNSCGHTHARCPRGHSYAGLMACDTSPWGSYAVEAVLLARIAQCEDCNEEVVQAALISVIDRRKRVLLSNQLFKGALGVPDMSHSKSVIEDIR
jgi:hypothetical protein